MTDFYTSKSKDLTKRYGYSIVDKPGVFEWLDKSSLHVDDSYQRKASQARIKLINKNWSWIACGTILIAERQDGYFVMDGQHRVLAAMTRNDINLLPCMIYQVQSVKDEASGFLTTQIGRKPLSTLDRFQAQIIADDQDAIFVKNLLDKYGYKPGTPSQESLKHVRCLSTLLTWTKTDKNILDATWPLIVKLCEKKFVIDKLVGGLCYIAKHAKGEGINNKFWEERIIATGYDCLMDGARKAMLFHEASGEKIWALGFVKAINKGRRSQIELKTNE